jgi:tRNA(Arg) A34 adenosine deaminase TadA
MLDPVHEGFGAHDVGIGVLLRFLAAARARNDDVVDDDLISHGESSLLRARAWTAPDWSYRSTGPCPAVF